MTVFRKIGEHNRATGAIAGKRRRKALGLPTGVGYSVPLPRDLFDKSCLAGDVVTVSQVGRRPDG